MDFFSQEVINSIRSWFTGSRYLEKIAIEWLIFVPLAILFFLIPIVIAFFRRHKNFMAISVMCAVPFIACLLTLFGVMGISSKENATGYVFLVWAIALIWSVSKPLTIEIKSKECENIKTDIEYDEIEE